MGIWSRSRRKKYGFMLAINHSFFFIPEMRYTLDIKTAQLDTAKARLIELESQLSRRDSMFTDQKRLLKTVKEEYQDKFKSLEEKYTAQKAIILRLEEELLELYNINQAAVTKNSTLLSPDTDKAGKQFSRIIKSHTYFFFIP